MRFKTSKQEHNLVSMESNAKARHKIVFLKENKNISFFYYAPCKQRLLRLYKNPLVRMSLCESCPVHIFLLEKHLNLNFT